MKLDIFDELKCQNHMIYHSVTCFSFLITSTLDATITKVGRKNPTEIRKQLYVTPNVELVDHCGVQLKDG